MPAPATPVLPPWSQVVRVAAAQRLLIWIFFGGLLALPLSLLVASDRSGAAAIAVIVLVVAVRIAMAVAVYRVAAALGSRLAILWAIGGFLPNVIGLLVLLVVNSKATRFLKAAGQKPGFMGVTLPAQPPPGYGAEGLGRIFS